MSRWKAQSTKVLDVQGSSSLVDVTCLYDVRNPCSHHVTARSSGLQVSHKENRQAEPLHSLYWVLSASGFCLGELSGFGHFEFGLPSIYSWRGQWEEGQSYKRPAN